MKSSFIQTIDSPAGEASAAITLRHPQAEDGASVHALIGRCPPLDLNSRYAYLLICDHFAFTSVLAENEQGEVVGYISGYLKPEEPEVLFIWQVAVDSSVRGRNIASFMLDAILQSQKDRGIRFVETTITPTNEASWKLFRGLARRWDAPCNEQPYFTEEKFGGQDHEREDLLRIGPIVVRSLEQTL